MPFRHSASGGETLEIKSSSRLLGICWADKEGKSGRDPANYSSLAEEKKNLPHPSIYPEGFIIIITFHLSPHVREERGEYQCDNDAVEVIRMLLGRYDNAEARKPRQFVKEENFSSERKKFTMVR